MTIQDSSTLPAVGERRQSRLDVTLAHAKNLCLDAPLVALVWQDLLARSWEAPIQPIHRILLATVAWLAYMGDRLLDGPRQGRSCEGSERHRYVWAHRKSLFLLWAFVAGTGTALSLWLLEVSDLLPGLWAFLGLTVYFVAARSWPRVCRGRLPREFLVGLFFSVACHLFVFSTLGRIPESGVATCLAFAMLCTLDCWAISCSDIEQDLRQGEWNLVTTYAWARASYPRAVLAALALTLAVSALLAPGPAIAWRAIALSCLLLFLLHRTAGATGRLALYTDLALLTPLLFLFLT